MYKIKTMRYIISPIKAKNDWKTIMPNRNENMRNYKVIYIIGVSIN